jgi:hypothetical protein
LSQEGNVRRSSRDIGTRRVNEEKRVMTTTRKVVPSPIGEQQSKMRNELLEE